MTTINYRSGSADSLTLRPTGDPAPTAVQLRIPAGNTCVVMDAVASGDAFDVDLRGLDLSPRLYRAAIWYDSGDGWRWASDFVLNIEGGC